MINRLLHRIVDAEGLEGVANIKNWPDNQPGAWYYYDILECANYHAYERSNRPMIDRGYNIENWVEIYPHPDWDKEDAEWIKYMKTK